VSRTDEIEVCLEQMKVDTIEALKDQYGEWRLAVRHYREPNKWTEGSSGSR
jgi:hypothetical protein